MSESDLRLAHREDQADPEQQSKLAVPWWHYLGAGIVSGASDNDPTTVASLAVIGASTVYALGWLVLLVMPMLAVVQAISARVGGVTRRGLESTLRKRYGKAAALIALVSMLAVNAMTLAADIEGGAAALQLLTAFDYRWFVIPIAGVSGWLIIGFNYERVKHVLVLLPMLFLTYAIAAVLAHPNWERVLHDSFVPHLERGKDFASGAIALLGTTLTAYAYVWQTQETAEEKPPLRRLGLVQADAVLGTVVAVISFWFIVVATGATLGVHHKSVETAQDAAAALTPFAGRYAALLFGVGLLASSLIAVPVLGATTAYVTAQMFRWQEGIDRRFHRAPAFFGVLIAALALASIMALAGVPAIKLLFISSIAGGLATPITLFMLLLTAHDRAVMGRLRIRMGLALCGWATFGIVTVAALYYLYQVFTGQS